jgi:hypothetical protein
MSDLHPNSLTLDDVKPGVEFVSFNMNWGMNDPDTFISEPFEYDGSLWVKVASKKEFDREDKEPWLVCRSLADMGIVKYDGSWWNSHNFTLLNTPENVAELKAIELIPYEYEDDYDCGYDDYLA